MIMWKAQGGAGHWCGDGAQLAWEVQLDTNCAPKVRGTRSDPGQGFYVRQLKMVAQSNYMQSY